MPRHISDIAAAVNKTFDGKSAIITGGSSGIGKALGAELVGFGAHVVLVGTDEQKLQHAADEMRGAGSVETERLDVRDFSGIERLVSRIAHERGRLDLMFNNAGVGVLGMAHEFSLDDWLRVIDVNLKGTVHGIHAAYRLMVRQGHGHIINTSSLAGLFPVPGQISYCTTKHALVGLSHALRIEASRHGVRVSVACPAAVETPIFKNNKWINLDADRLLANMPGKPDDARRCARQILKGVRKNQATIVPGFAGLLWRAHRYTPFLTRLMQRKMYKDLAGNRNFVLGLSSAERLPEGSP